MGPCGGGSCVLGQGAGAAESLPSTLQGLRLPIRKVKL